MKRNLKVKIYQFLFVCTVYIHLHCDYIIRDAFNICLFLYIIQDIAEESYFAVGCDGLNIYLRTNEESEERN